MQPTERACRVWSHAPTGEVRAISLAPVSSVVLANETRLLPNERKVRTEMGTRSPVRHTKLTEHRPDLGYLPSLDDQPVSEVRLDDLVDSKLLRGNDPELACY